MNPIAKKTPQTPVLRAEPTDAAVTGAQSPSRPGRDERRSRRCTVPRARQSCKLKFGARILSASLLNESKGGFAVLTDRLEGLTVGKKVELHTRLGHFMVRVIYINEVARRTGAAPRRDAGFQLGLKKACSSVLS
jgi:hypothetical protein